MKFLMTKKEGSALAYGLVIIAALSIILTGVMQFIVSQIKYSAFIEDKEKAFHIAESGIYFYRWYLAHQIEGKSQDEINDFWEDDDPAPLGLDENYIKDYFNNSGNKIGEVEIDVNVPTAGNYNIVEVTATGYSLDKPEIKRTIRTVLRRSIWSDFAVISDGPVCFDQYWTINGKVMGNNGVHFNGVGNNVVAAGVASYDDHNSLHSDYDDKPGVWEDNPDKEPGEIFKAGTRFPVPKKDFSGITSYLQMMRTKSRLPGNSNNNGCDVGGCFFDGSEEGWRIILKNDDTFDVCPVAEINTANGQQKNEPKKYKKIGMAGTCNDCVVGNDCHENISIPNDLKDNLVIYVDDNVWLEGQVNDIRVTVVAANLPDPAINSNIYIMDDIIYTAPYDGSDAIGILAEGDVEILRRTENELIIHGAILAQKGAVTKPEYNPECCGGGCTNNKNYLDILGCVITKNGLQFSLHKEDCPGLVLDRTITYDSNLYSSPPPFFPADSFYYVDFWEEV